MFKFNSLELVPDITFEIYSKMLKLKLKVSGLVSTCEELTEQPFQGWEGVFHNPGVSGWVAR